MRVAGRSLLPRPWPPRWPCWGSPSRPPRPRRPSCSSPSTSRAPRTTRRWRSSTAPARRSTWPPAATRCRCTSTAPPAAGLTINLTGTVASGDVFVLAHSAAEPRHPGPGRPDQRRRLVQRRRRDRAAQGRRRPSSTSIGQIGVDPGTEWGTGLASTADNTLRRKAGVEAGDTDADRRLRPGRAVGRLRHRHLRRARRPLDGDGPDAAGRARLRRAAGHVGRHRRHPDGHRHRRRRHDHRPRRHLGRPGAGGRLDQPYGRSRRPRPPAARPAPRSRSSADVPAGSYAVTVTSTDADGATATCTFTVQVTDRADGRRGAGPDPRHRERRDRPLAAGPGHRQRQLGAAVRRARRDHPADAGPHLGRRQPVRLLPAEPRSAPTDGDPRTSDGIFVFMGGFTSADRRLRADGRRRGRAAGPGGRVLQPDPAHQRLAGHACSPPASTSNSTVEVDRRGAAGRPGRRRPVLGAARGQPACGCGRAAARPAAATSSRPPPTPRSGWSTWTTRCWTGPTRTPGGSSATRTRWTTTRRRSSTTATASASCSAASA